MLTHSEGGEKEGKPCCDQVSVFHVIYLLIFVKALLALFLYLFIFFVKCVRPNQVYYFHRKGA